MTRTRLRIATLLLFFIILVLPLPCGYGQTVQPQEQPAARYAIAFRLPLSQGSNGIDGHLELRQDARVTSKLSGLMWGTGNVNIDDDPELAMFKSEPLRNSVIQVVDRAGKVLDEQRLERRLQNYGRRNCMEILG
jgi:hypothetical protein